MYFCRFEYERPFEIIYEYRMCGSIGDLGYNLYTVPKLIPLPATWRGILSEIFEKYINIMSVKFLFQLEEF